MYYNIRLHLSKIKFIIENLKQIEEMNNDKDLCQQLRFAREDIFWNLSRQCGCCKDFIDMSFCCYKKEWDNVYCEIKNCPLLK